MTKIPDFQTAELPALIKEIAEQLIKLSEVTRLVYDQIQSLEQRIDIIEERTL